MSSPLDVPGMLNVTSPWKSSEVSSPTKQLRDLALRSAEATTSSGKVAGSALEMEVLGSPLRRYSDLPARHTNSLDPTALPRRLSDLSNSPRKSRDLSSPSIAGHSRRSTNVDHSSPTITILPRRTHDIASPPGILRSISAPPVRQNDAIGPLRRLSQVLASPIASPSGRGSDSNQISKISEASWEVLSKLSTTSHRLSIQQDLSDPNHKLVPLWECLQVS